MLANKGDLNDVAIYWSRKSPALAEIRRTGQCPSFGVPRKLRVPGGLVALVDRIGTVLLVFRVARVDEGVPLIAADGKWHKQGCLLVARHGSVRNPGPRDPKLLNVNRHALGAFAYFDAETYTRVVYEPGYSDGAGGSVLRQPYAPFPSRRYPLFANNIGKTLNQPEKSLIEAYTTWVGDVRMFVHHPLKQTGLYTDIFIPRRWTLVEAKASVGRKTLREAVGQLFDYQRHYDRSPRLAVLLSRQPPQSVMGLFIKKRIVVVWRSRGGTFRDSDNGSLTAKLRAVAGTKRRDRTG